MHFCASNLVKCFYISSSLKFRKKFPFQGHESRYDQIRLRYDPDTIHPKSNRIQHVDGEKFVNFCLRRKVLNVITYIFSYYCAQNLSFLSDQEFKLVICAICCTDMANNDTSSMSSTPMEEMEEEIPDEMDEHEALALKLWNERVDRAIYGSEPLFEAMKGLVVYLSNLGYGQTVCMCNMFTFSRLFNCFVAHCVFNCKIMIMRLLLTHS